MLRGANLLCGYEIENEPNLFFAEQHVYVVDIDDSTDEDGVDFWDSIGDMFRPFRFYIGDSKKILHPVTGRENDAFLFHRSIRNVSYIGVGTDEFNADMRTPQLITSLGLFFNSRAELQKYAAGINVDVESDEAINVLVSRL